MLDRIAQLLLACCVLLPITTMAQPRPDQQEEGADNKPWVELEIKLPPYPKPEHLLPFEPSAATSHRFHVDPASIAVGSDGVVRYTLVVRSPSGAENVSYEGMRCDTIEQKYYAFGRRDGTWSRTRTSEWRRIKYQSLNRHHGVLYADYFCPDGAPIKSPPDAVKRFQYGVPYGAPPRSGN